VFDVGELDARGAIVINAEPSLDPPHESTQAGMHAIAERSRTYEYSREAKGLVGLLLEQNAVDSAHLATVPIDHRLVEHVPNDVHVSLR